jgi:(p)ppGpp synthase/HD superfamily hydrolase
MIRFEDILDKIESYNPGFDEELLQKAYIFSAREHRGQVRSSAQERTIAAGLTALPIGRIIREYREPF